MKIHPYCVNIWKHIRHNIVTLEPTKQKRRTYFFQKLVKIMIRMYAKKTQMTRAKARQFITNLLGLNYFFHSTKFCFSFSGISCIFHGLANTFIFFVFRKTLEIIHGPSFVTFLCFSFFFFDYVSFLLAIFD